MGMMRIGLFAAGILALTVTSAWAFSQQIVSPDGGNYQFSDPDKKLTDPDNHNSGQNTQTLGNGLSVQFGTRQGPLGQTNRYGTPDPYFGSLRGN
jgi:hypothetical protein